MPHKDPEKAREYKRIWRQNNKEAIAERNRIWRQNNKYAKAEYQRIYRKNNKEAIAEQDQIWRQTNKEAIVEYKRLWYKNNKVKNRACWSRRRAKKLNAPGRGVTSKQWKSILEAANGVCTYCGGVFESLSMDHIIPLDNGGAHDIDNITPACKPCNSSKGTKILYEEWTPPKLLSIDTTHQTG